MLRFFRSLLTTSIITSVAFLFLGLAFIFYPEPSLSVLANTIAVMLIIYGVYGLILSFQSISVSYSINIGSSIISLVLGMVVLMNNHILQALIPVILGVFFVVNGVNKLRYAMVVKKEGRGWLMPLIISVLLILCGVLMLAHPIFTAVAMTTFVGILMVAYAIVDLIDAAFLKRKLDSIDKYFRRGKHSARVREAEIVDKNRKV